MKKYFLGFIIFFLLAFIAVNGEENNKPPALLFTLSYTATLGIFADTMLTYDAILNHNCYEGNPFWRPLMKYPPVVLTLDLAIGAGITILAHKLYPKNKALSWAIAIGANIVQGYFLYWHYELRRNPRWIK